MRQIFLLALALLCAPVQAAIGCLPVTIFTPFPIAMGSVTKSVETDAATADAWWCPIYPDGVLRYQVNVMWSLKKTKAAYDWGAAFIRIKAAPSMLDALNGELASNSAATAPGSQDEYEVNLVKYRACLALATKPYVVSIPDLPANFCGVAPTPPGPSAVTWLTPSSTTLKVYSNNSGKLGPAIAGRTAPPNAKCNSSVPQVKLGTSVYFPLLTGPLNELVLCKLVQ